MSGKRETNHQEKTDTHYACERSYGSFARITLGKIPESQATRVQVQAGPAKPKS